MRCGGGLLHLLLPLHLAQQQHQQPEFIQARRNPGETAGCWDGSFTYQRCCLEDDAMCWLEGLSKELCCSAFIEVVLRSGEEGPLHWHFPNADDAVGFADGEPELRACMEAKYQMPWNEAAKGEGEDEEKDALCENNFVQAAACVARLEDVKVIFDIFLGGGCTLSAMAYASLMAGHRPSAEILSFDLPKKLTESTSPGSRLAEGEGIWWNMALLNESNPQQLQQKLLEPRLSSLSRLVLIGEDLQATNSWNSLDVLCQHRRVDFVVVDSSPNVIMEKEWLIIEAVCRPKRILLTNLNIPGASSWIWQRLMLLGWSQILAGHYLLGDQPWPHHSEMRRLRKWAVLLSPR